LPLSCSLNIDSYGLQQMIASIFYSFSPLGVASLGSYVLMFLVFCFPTYSLFEGSQSVELERPGHSNILYRLGIQTDRAHLSSAAKQTDRRALHHHTCRRSTEQRSAKLTPSRSKFSLPSECGEKESDGSVSSSPPTPFHGIPLRSSLLVMGSKD